MQSTSIIRRRVLNEDVVPSPFLYGHQRQVGHTDEHSNMNNNDSIESIQTTTTTTHSSPPEEFTRVTPTKPSALSSEGGLSMTAESLVTLLKRVRSQDPNVQWVVLERKKLPAPYLIALLNAVAHSKHVTKLRLHRVISVSLADNENDDVTQKLEVANAMAECVRYSMSLENLDVSKNNIGDLGCIAMAEAFLDIGKSSMIKRLNLSNNGIGFAGISALCEALPHTNVSILKLGNNCFGLDGLQTLCDQILTPKACLLSSLDLRGNDLGKAGTEIIAQSLFQTTTLRVLYLNRNNLDNQCVQILARALENNRSLQTLDLQRNDMITDVGARCFVCMLQVYNDTFTKLKIRKHTSITDDAKRELLDWLLVNSYGPVLARKTKYELHNIQSYLLASTMQQITRGKQCHPARSIRSMDNEEENYLDSTSDEDNECVICFESAATSSILLPCRHHNVCNDCAERLEHCHMCRETIVKVFNIPPEIRSDKRHLFNDPYFNVPQTFCTLAPSN